MWPFFKLVLAGLVGGVIAATFFIALYLPAPTLQAIGALSGWVAGVLAVIAALITLRPIIGQLQEMKLHSDALRLQILSTSIEEVSEIIEMLSTIKNELSYINETISERDINLNEIKPLLEQFWQLANKLKVRFSGDLLNDITRSPVKSFLHQFSELTNPASENCIARLDREIAKAQVNKTISSADTLMEALEDRWIAINTALIMTSRKINSEIDIIAAEESNKSKFGKI